mmetsp:Transcript_9393/g.25948  ORF Transcript_9393/g.25948 Transcript_9393/m.25948 type:complete len:87 (+) Transcript_9393:58-318(+)
MLLRGLQKVQGKIGWMFPPEMMPPANEWETLCDEPVRGFSIQELTTQTTVFRTGSINASWFVAATLQLDTTDAAKCRVSPWSIHFV